MKRELFDQLKTIHFLETDKQEFAQTKLKLTGFMQQAITRLLYLLLA